MICEVIVDISSSEIDRVFDYKAPSDVLPGTRVLVPFGGKTTEGFVIGLKEQSDVPEDKLKEIEAVPDPFVAISPDRLELMRFMCRKYHLRKIDALRLFIPSKMRGGGVRDIMLPFCTLTDDAEKIIEKLSSRAKQQIECVRYLKDKGDFSAELNKLFGSAAVSALKEKGYVKTEEVHVKRKPEAAAFEAKKVVLTAAQQAAVDRILASDKTEVLHGVTGSGKTEVYMAVIDEGVKKGKTAIVLVPEISLTPQIFGLFRSRFSDAVAILHSGLSDGERYDEWKRILEGEAKIVIGARSAIFAPVENIGVVIIDEEHDGSYVSESNPRYDAKVIAEFRAKQWGAPLVLGSATPSVETYYAAKTGRYGLVELKSRINQKAMPEIEIVDMSREIRLGNRDILSKPLKTAMEEALFRGEQVILFLNRRGYFSYFMCRDCGYIAKCESCDVSLTYHKTENRLKCHCCGKTYRMMSCCPSCGSERIRQGHIGTEQVAEEVAKRFPNAKVLRMDNDTTRTKNSHKNILEAFKSGEANVLVGTQMIAKGHDFSNVTVVGILEADYSLYLSDYRSNERTFQLVTQVAGRAGRGEKGGKVYLQTYTPRHYVFRYASAYDYEGFFGKELNSRETAKFPPFAVIVRVLVAAAEDAEAKKTARGIYDDLTKFKKEKSDAFIYFQGMKSPIERAQDLFRYQILMRIKADRFDGVIDEIYEAADRYKNKKNTVFVEINPQNLN